MKHYCDECKGELKFFDNYAYCESCGIEYPYKEDDYEKYLKTYPLIKKKPTTEAAVEEAKGQISDREKVLDEKLSLVAVAVFLIIIAVFIFGGIKIMSLGYQYTVLSFGVLGIGVAIIGGFCYYLFYFFNNKRKARRDIKKLNKRIKAEEAVLGEIANLPSYEDFLKEQEE